MRSPKISGLGEWVGGGALVVPLGKKRLAVPYVNRSFLTCPHNHQTMGTDLLLSSLAMLSEKQFSVTLLFPGKRVIIFTGFRERGPAL